jgi:hypothetical protein
LISTRVRETPRTAIIEDALHRHGTRTHDEDLQEPEHQQPWCRQALFEGRRCADGAPAALLRS